MAWRVTRQLAGGLILALLLTLETSCLSSRQSEADNPLDGRSGARFIALEIENDNFNDARIYVLSFSGSRRIGMIIGGTAETFNFNWREDELRVRVDFIGAGGFTTGLILVSPGDVVYLRIPSH